MIFDFIDNICVFYFHMRCIPSIGISYEIQSIKGYVYGIWWYLCKNIIDNSWNNDLSEMIFIKHNLWYIVFNHDNEYDIDSKHSFITFSFTVRIYYTFKCLIKYKSFQSASVVSHTV